MRRIFSILIFQPPILFQRRFAFQINLSITHTYFVNTQILQFPKNAKNIGHFEVKPSNYMSNCIYKFENWLPNVTNKTTSKIAVET